MPASADRSIFSRSIASEALRSVVFETNPPLGFGLDDLAFDQATFDRLRPLHPLYDATNPDLSAFEAAGGKLILWHGLADTHFSLVNTIAYHAAVEGLLGRRRAEALERLYLFPGMYRCAGGDGPSSVDLVTPMLAWVEAGIAPEAIVARQPERSAVGDFGAPGMRAAGPDGKRGGPPPEGGPSARPVQAGPSGAIVRSRPVYPFPGIAAYDGHGDPKQRRKLPSERFEHGLHDVGVEGQVHRLKLIKRSMYGRAGLDRPNRRLPSIPARLCRRSRSAGNCS